MANVVAYRNALNPRDDVAYKCYENIVTVYDVLNDLGIIGNNIGVIINGEERDEVRESDELHPDDFVQIISIPEGGDSNKIFSQIVNIGLIVGGALSGQVQLVVAGAAGFISNIISAQSRKNLSNFDGSDQTSPNYSISAAGNQARQLGPIPLVLSGDGHRMFPDFASKPYGGIEAYEPGATTDIPSWLSGGTFDMPVDANGMTRPGLFYGISTIDWIPHTYAGYSYSVLVESRIDPDGGSPLGETVYGVVMLDPFAESGYSLVTTPQLNAPSPSNTRYTRRSYVFFDEQSDPLFGNYALLDEFLAYLGGDPPPSLINGITVINPGTGGPGTPGFDYEINQIIVQVPYEYLGTITIQNDRFRNKIYHHFNFGFGDLDISDHKFQNTPLSSFFDVSLSREAQSLLDWKMGTVIYGSEIPRTNVDSIEGGLLSNNNPSYLGAFTGPTVAISTTDTSKHNWIYRTGPAETLRIEIILDGRQFKQDPTDGVVDLTQYYQIQYKLTSSSVWTNMSGVSPSIRWFDTYPVKKQYSIDVPSGQYDVRVRKQSRDTDGQLSICEMSFVEVRFIQSDGANYIGQNQRGIVISASAETSGHALDRYSAYVKSKTWRYNSISDNYQWDYSSNPSDMFLYFALGGFKTNQIGSGVFPSSPTVGWSTCIDTTGASERLFGAGLSLSRIDLDVLKEWSLFCDQKNLKFDAILDSDRNCWDVLGDIAQAGRGYLTWASGKLGVIWESELDQPVAMFGMNNIIKDSFSIAYNNLDRAEEIVVKFADRNNEWEQAEARTNRPDIASPVRSRTTEAWGITSYDQAKRLANILAAQEYVRKRTISFETDIEHLIATRGDVVYLSHDLIGWDKSDRVKQIEIESGLLLRFKTWCSFASATYAIIRLMNGDMIKVEIEQVDDWMVVTSGAVSASDLPSVLNSIDFTENTESLYENSQPEDIMVIVGDGSEPRKKVRIASIQPSGDNKASIVCVDEDPFIYSYEYNDLPSSIPDTSEVVSPEVVSSVKNVSEIVNGDTVTIFWDNDGSIGCLVHYAINGGTEIQYNESGSYTFSSSVSVQVPTGAHVRYRLVPISVGAPFVSNEYIGEVFLEP